MLEAEPAIERATRLAAEQGWDLADYDDPVAELEGASWIVRFEGAVPAPGNHLVVVVDATSGTAEVWPGR